MTRRRTAGAGARPRTALTRPAGPVTPAGPVAVAGGIAELQPDPYRAGAWQLLVDGTPQSHVDLTDPTHLEFEYVRRIGHVLDIAAPAGRPLDVVHLGGGALTLARYVAATRPGSRQRVVEIDEPLVDLVRARLPLPRTARIRVRIADARASLASLPAGSADVVISDVFSGARTLAHVATVEYVAEAHRVLRPEGVFCANLADGPPLRFARAQVATLRAAFAEVCLVAEPGTFRGRRFGNLVAVASDAPLPSADLSRRCAADPMPGRVLDGAELDRFAGDATPVHDSQAQPSPEPPPDIFGR